MTTPQNSHRARARLSDPYTSQQAAAVATRNLPTVRATVLAILLIWLDVPMQYRPTLIG